MVVMLTGCAGPVGSGVDAGSREGDDASRDAAARDAAPSDAGVASDAPHDARLEADALVPVDACADVCDGTCVDLASDPRHCGSCATDCAALPGVESVRCVAGECVVDECAAGRADCSAGDGCETEATTVADCGACGNACAIAGQICAASSDGYSCTCAGAAPDACASECVDLASDPLNCGACEMACPVPARGTATCSARSCGITCDAGFHACGSQCASDEDATRCGASCTVCGAPVGATAVCIAGACDFTCPAGESRSGGACVPIPAPRPVAPLSTASVSSRTPTLRWALADGTTGAHVEICADRACAMPITSFDATGASGAPPSALPRGVAFWRVRGRAGGSTGTALSPTWQFTVPAVTAPRDASWGTTFDANGDGLGDPIVTTLSGTTFVFPASATGPSPSDEVRIAALGASASAGDVDGDGFSDLVAASPRSSGAATVALHRGGASGVSTSAVTTLSNAVSSEGFGAAVASAGDVNGDGYADVIVGGTGFAWIHLGAAGGLDTTASARIVGADSSFGAAVAGVGDLDGDGFGDVMVGAPSAGSTGRAYVYRGSAAGTLTLVRALDRGTSAATRFGFAVASAGDVDGNGYADLAVGAPGNAGTDGFVWVYRVRSTGIAATADAFGDSRSLAGTSVAGAGDVDGDGFDDVLVGAPGYSGGDGRVFVLRGSASGILVGSELTLYGSSLGSWFGSSVAGVGDTNGDDMPDVVVGAPVAFSSRGQAVVLRGSATLVLDGTPRPNITGPDTGPNRFGHHVSGRQ